MYGVGEANKLFVGRIDDVANNFFLRRLWYYKFRRNKFYQKTNVMEGDYFGTINLLPNAEENKDEKFFEHLDKLKYMAEGNINCSLHYNYVHMVDYEKGGEMIVHNHRHAGEDYASLLYLNDSDNGATFFFVDNKRHEVLPERGKILMYPSDIMHGSNYAISKKVLVVGYNINN